MDRTAARALIKTTLESLGTYTEVVQGVPDLFKGRSPIAVITSRSMDLNPVARELATMLNGITVSIYVRKESGAASACEDLLDSLTKAAVLALHATDSFLVSESNADVASGNLRDVDSNGVLYRVERIPLTVLDEQGYG